MSSERVVWKWELNLQDEQVVYLPERAEILTVRMQGRSLCLWAVCARDAPSEARKIFIHGTGHLVAPAPLRYIDTFFIDNGILVFHVFVAISAIEQ